MASAGLPQNELLQPIPDVAHRLTGRRPSHATQWRWLRQGCRGVKLKALMLGGQWLCTEDDFREFLRAQTEAQLQRHPGGDAEEDDVHVESPVTPTNSRAE